MAEITSIQFYRGTAAAWTSANPTLAAGKPGFETDTGKLKIGDGTTAWTSLGYQATESYVASAVAGLMDYRGTFDASVNAYPSSGGSGTAGAILKSDFWIVSVAGTLPTGLVVAAGDLVIAKVDTPGNTQANWSIVEYNIGFTPVNKAGDTMGGDLAMGSNKITGLGAASANGDAVRYEQLASNSTKTASYALVQANDKTTVFFNSSTAANLTVDQLTADSWVAVVNYGDGDVSLVAGTGVTLDGEITALPGGVISSCLLWFKTATDVKVIGGGSSNLQTLYLNGLGYIKAGVSSGVNGKIPAVVYKDTTAVGNVGTGEDNLQAYAMPAGVLGTNEDSVVIHAAGTFANTSNNRRFRIKLGATTVFDSGSIAVTTSGSWSLRCVIYRTAATTEKIVGVLTSDIAAANLTKYTTASEDTSTALTIQLTAEATANNDISSEFFSVEWKPAN